MDIVNPYIPGQADLIRENRKPELELADRLSRLFAVLMDAGVFVVPGILLAITTPGLFSGGNSYKNLATIGTIVVIALFVWLVYNLKLMHEHGQTFGKRMLGIKVVRTDGSRLGLLRWITLRILAIGLIGAIPFVGWIANVADILAIFRDSRQCLHDQIADTMVVKI